MDNSGILTKRQLVSSGSQNIPSRDPDPAQVTTPGSEILKIHQTRSTCSSCNNAPKDKTFTAFWYFHLNVVLTQIAANCRVNLVLVRNLGHDWGCFVTQK